jgi:hypothetical protein
VHDSTQNNESIYALSNIGVYYRNKDMPGWLLYTNNLPLTPRFTDLDIYNDPTTPANSRLRLSTYGRGLWESPLSVTGTLLPLTLLGLSANPENGYNKIVWKTANESNTKNFEIEISYDGRNFRTYSSIAAAGNSTVERTYSFNDYSIMPGIATFYRIKANDLEGKFTYSNIAVVYAKSNNQNTISIINNPIIGNKVNILINAKKEQRAALSIIDMNGKRLLAKQIQLNKGGQLFIVDEVVKTAGMYIVEILMQDGSIIQSKLLKQ